MALTLFEDFVYWTDGKSKSLRRAHKTTGAQGVELLNSWQAIKSIKVYHSLRQPEGITSICLSRPRWAVARSCCTELKGGMVDAVSLWPLYSAQTPVSDCKWRMQPPVSSVTWWRAQVCLSYQFLLGCWQQDVSLQLHLQSGQPHFLTSVLLTLVWPCYFSLP